MPNTGCHSPSLVFFLQNKHDELEAKFFEERAVLEAKYQKLYEPLYAKRYEIVNGVVEVGGIKDESSVETPAKDKASEVTTLSFFGQAEQLQSQMELDYDIGSTIRDKIIPHAVSWFTGEAVQDDDTEIEDDEDGEDEEEEDEDEEDEDMDDEDEEEKGKSKKKVSSLFLCICYVNILTDSIMEIQKSGGEQVDRPAECKQQ
ncbi:hypothetical protein BHE74_00046750 [Ensete ventricosum]|nr:hypothetical protein BHE74_00046750 [Ensete ventricosum]